MTNEEGKENVPNADLIRQTIRAMEENREMWNQQDWLAVPDVDEVGWEDKPICGTTLCFAGFAVAVDMGPAEFFAAALAVDYGGEWEADPDFYYDIEDRAMRALGLDEVQANHLFRSMTDDLDAYKALVTAVTGVEL